MTGCLEEELGKWPWSQPSGMELPAPFQALASRAWAGQAGWLAGQLLAAPRFLMPLVTLGWEGVQAHMGLRGFTRGH